jgi:hypothetical protein
LECCDWSQLWISIASAKRKLFFLVGRTGILSFVLADAIEPLGGSLGSPYL